MRSDADGGATRRLVSAGVVTRGGRCLKAWTKKQQVVSPSSPESELYAAVKAASEGLGIQSVAKDIVCAESTPGRLRNSVPGQSQRARQQVGLARHEEGWHERESSQLDDESATVTENRTTDEPHGLRVHED